MTENETISENNVKYNKRNTHNMIKQQFNKFKGYTNKSNSSYKNGARKKNDI